MRKGQEEIVGFVLVVVLVVVVGLVFLGIMIRQPASVNEKESKDVYNFIRSSLSYTTTCSIDGGFSYYDISDLIRRCYSEEGFICYNGEKGCEVLKNTTKEILEVSWQISEEAKYKGYILNITYSSNVSQKNEQSIMEIASGSCASSIIGSEESIPAPSRGNIILSLKICY